MSEPLDVHRVAAGIVPDGSFHLRGAVSVHAPVDRLFGKPDHFAAARRADGGHLERLFRAGPCRFYDLDHFRDHLAGAANDHRIADENVLAADFVHVVQRGALHRDAAHQHGV